jgi:Ca2+/Na+ antiporter
METLSFIVLILLSLVGYSGGTAGKAGKHIDIKPQLFDLIIILLIWTGAIYSRLTFDLNKWLLILIWVVLAATIGVIVVLFRKLPKEKSSHNKEPEKVPKNLIKKLWQRWGNFSYRMGSFQSRIILSLFYFVFVTPFALAVKIFSDPLNIKHQTTKSHWLTKKEINADLEQSRRQF